MQAEESTRKGKKEGRNVRFDVPHKKTKAGAIIKEVEEE